MTPDEARKIIKQFRDRQGNSSDDIEAFDMAIKELEQQPCEDCISREALLEELGEEPFNWNDSPEEFQEVRDYQWFRSLIENAPSVAPQQKVGEWIPCTKTGLPLTEQLRRERAKWFGYKCSKCNDIYKGNALLECNYCQNCGAKMIER